MEVLQVVRTVQPALWWEDKSATLYEVSSTYYFASNNGNCMPNESNIYNFGYAVTTVNGETSGTDFYGDGTTSITDVISCFRIS